MPADFVANLLGVRVELAPAYTRLAVERAPEQVLACLAALTGLEDTPAAYATFDWQLQHCLTLACGNPIYTLILNGFAGVYAQVAPLYFATSRPRQHSLAYYRDLETAASQGDAATAATITRQVMQESIELWRERAAS